MHLIHLHVGGMDVGSVVALTCKSVVVPMAHSAGMSDTALVVLVGTAVAVPGSTAAAAAVGGMAAARPSLVPHRHMRPAIPYSVASVRPA